jgi:hypothetical protein
MVDYPVIIDADGLASAVESFQWLKDQKSHYLTTMEKIIVPIRQGLDKLYEIRRNVEAAFDAPLDKISIRMATFHSEERLRLEARAREIVETAIETDEVVDDLPEPTKVAGLHFRETWSAQVVDLERLILSIAAGEPGTSTDLLKPNMTACHQLARALKDQLAPLNIGIIAKKKETPIVK